ncbi:MAG: CCA tRNA nucleotidyltransferase [Sedimentisphaerales bacterium]|nr:CCA tRNA nucleotidyltransferase [Sedimentisphaerales bacterium]
MTNRQAAVEIVRRLREAGFEALLAGGCVRDMLLKRRPSDYDVATDAKPNDVTRIFRRTLRVGAKFGVVVVLIDKLQIEVATFRTESGYEDGRHPTKVSFATAKKDAARRDFTINTMFYDPIAKKVIDYYGGQADLKKGLIRTAGKPAERFSEDYLRMLRALRFSTQLGFSIEPKTWAAIYEGAGNITKISGERIATELEGILVSPSRAKGAQLLIETGLAGFIFPGFTGPGSGFAVQVLNYLPKTIGFPLGLAALFTGFETSFALEKCEFLKLSRNQHKHIEFLLDNRGKLLKDLSLAELKLTASGPYFEDLFALQKAIQKTSSQSISPLVKLRKKIRQLKGVELRPKPILNGHNLIALGAVPGPALGQLAREMYIAQLEGQLQSAEQARHWATKWLQSHKKDVD